jgi:hypothetical protein
MVEDAVLFIDFLWKFGINSILSVSKNKIICYDFAASGKGGGGTGVWWQQHFKLTTLRACFKLATKN